MDDMPLGSSVPGAAKVASVFDTSQTYVRGTLQRACVALDRGLGEAGHAGRRPVSQRIVGKAGRGDRQRRGGTGSRSRQ